MLSILVHFVVVHMFGIWYSQSINHLVSSFTGVSIRFVQSFFFTICMGVVNMDIGVAQDMKEKKTSLAGSLRVWRLVIVREQK